MLIVTEMTRETGGGVALEHEVKSRDLCAMAHEHFWGDVK